MNNQKGCVVFFDLTKAFDKVRHEHLNTRLREMEFPEKIINLISACYRNARSDLCFCDVRATDIQYDAGLMQGCPMSPTFFSLIISRLGCALENAEIGVDIDVTKIPDTFLCINECVIKDIKKDIAKEAKDAAGLNETNYTD